MKELYKTRISAAKQYIKRVAGRTLDTYNGTMYLMYLK
jgi:hypothetical protein